MAPIVSGGVMANVGDIAYKATDGSIKVVAPDAWDASLGTPIGVVVIPSGFAPDGLARILSLNWGTRLSTSSTSASGMSWGGYDTDTSLTNYNCVPTTDNAGSTTTGSTITSYLPSDKFTGATSYVDSTAKYYGGYSFTISFIPSPYLGDKPNPAYHAAISGKNNALSDFNGKGNTDVLVALGSDYIAANAARNYKAAGAEEIEWYLPAMGELGYLMVRYNKIQDALAKVNASKLRDGTGFGYKSSSEYSSKRAYSLHTSDGNIFNEPKNTATYVRPFAMLDF